MKKRKLNSKCTFSEVSVGLVRAVRSDMCPHSHYPTKSKKKDRNENLKSGDAGGGGGEF